MEILGFCDTMFTMAIKKVSDDELVEELKRRGFEVKKKIHYVKHGVEVDAVIWEHFKSYCKTHKIKIKDAISTALNNWVIWHHAENLTAPKTNLDEKPKLVLDPLEAAADPHDN